SDSRYVGVDADAGQYGSSGRVHGRPGSSNHALEVRVGCFHQQRVMDWGTNLDVLLGSQATSKPEHLGGVALHVAVPQSRRPGVPGYVQRPAVDGAQIAGQLADVDYVFGPLPERREGLGQGPEDLLGDDHAGTS